MKKLLSLLLCAFCAGVFALEPGDFKVGEKLPDGAVEIKDGYQIKGYKLYIMEEKVRTYVKINARGIVVENMTMGIFFSAEKWAKAWEVVMNKFLDMRGTLKTVGDGEYLLMDSEGNRAVILKRAKRDGAYLIIFGLGMIDKR